MMRFIRSTLMCLLLSHAVLAGQEILHMDIGDPTRREREVPVELDGITDTATGQIIPPREFARRLADTGILFVGETHTSQAFHDVQYQVIRALHETGREVLIGVEMFPYTEQAVLDDWNAKRFTADDFVERSRWYDNWTYNWNYYRTIFHYAQANGIGIHAVNCPRDLVKTVRSRGFGVLTPEQAAHLPPTLAAASDDYQRLYRASFGAGDSVHLNAQALGGMYRAQTLWDACMGWNALQALRQRERSGAIMIVLLGTGHVAYGLGSQRQIAPYYDGRIASLIPVNVSDGDDRPVSQARASYASFVWGVPGEGDPLYPELGISLMGKYGAEPGQIIRVDRNSVAERAGLRVGDVLLSIDGTTPGSDNALGKLMADCRWGDVVAAQIRRDGRVQDVVIPLRRALPDPARR